MIPEWLWPFIIVIFAACLTSIGLLYKRMSKAELELAEMRLQMKPYFEALQHMMAQKLTHENEKETDALLVKLVDKIITASETIKLKQFIRERASDPRFSVKEREDSIHFLWIMDEVVLEAEELAKKGTVE